MEAIIRSGLIIYPELINYPKYKKKINKFFNREMKQDIRKGIGGPFRCNYCGRDLNDHLRQVYRYEVTCPSCGTTTWSMDDKSLEVLQREENLKCQCGVVLNAFLSIFKWAHLFFADCCGRGFILYGNEDPETFRKRDGYECSNCGGSLNWIAQAVF